MTQEEILSQLLSEISDEFDKSVGSFFYDIDKPISDKLAKILYNAALDCKNGFAITASGKYLDNKVAEQGLVRKDATSATVTVTIKGTPGSTVSIGDKVASDALIFSVTESRTLDSTGTTKVTAQCDTFGKVGNVPTGAVNRFPVTLPGLVSVINEESASGGFDAETDEELRERYFEKVSLPATSGSKYHYVMWAKEVGGVGDAKCLPLWNGNGTVKVIIINSDKGVADSDLIERVAEHIEESRPIGAEVTIESAAPLVININAKVVLADSGGIEKAKAQITESINSYLKKNTFHNTYISYAQIGGCILSCTAVADYCDLRVNNGTENIEIGETQVPVLGVVSIDE